MTCNPQANDRKNLWNVEGNTHDHCECVCVCTCVSVSVCECVCVFVPTCLCAASRKGDTVKILFSVDKMDLSY